jgi:hypothetical protein
MIEGVDYAWARPTVASLVAAGKRFACRYGGPGSAGKQLDPTEARALAAAGIAIVANAEGRADGLAEGTNAGRDWAVQAEAHFAKCGMPPDRPIYLSVDFDVTVAGWLNVARALNAAAGVLGPARVGVYGGYKAMLWARRDDVAAWFWQTYAWSGGRWAPGNHCEQYDNGVSMGGGNVDLNRALKADYGQWIPEGGDMALTTTDVDLVYNEPLPLGAMTLVTGEVVAASAHPARARQAYAHQHSYAARRTAEAVYARVGEIEAKLDEILTALASGLPVAAEVKLSAEGMAQVEAIVDEQVDQGAHAD